MTTRDEIIKRLEDAVARFNTLLDSSVSIQPLDVAADDDCTEEEFEKFTEMLSLKGLILGLQMALGETLYDCDGVSAYYQKVIPGVQS